MSLSPQSPNKAFGAQSTPGSAVSYDWDSVVRSDPILRDLFGGLTIDPASEGGVAIVFGRDAVGLNLAQFHDLIEQKFQAMFFTYPFGLKDGRTKETSYFPGVSFGGVSGEQKEALRDWLYTNVYARWFAHVYLVERFGVERFERETGDISLAGVLHSAGIINAREQLLVLYQLISRNIESALPIRLPEALSSLRYSNTLVNRLCQEIAVVRTALHAAVVNGVHINKKDCPEGAVLFDGGLELFRPVDFDELDQGFREAEISYAPFRYDLLLKNIHAIERASDAMAAHGTLFEGVESMRATTPYVAPSSLVMHRGGFDPDAPLSPCLAACIRSGGCFDELLEVFPNVGMFLVKHGPTDHAILRENPIYRKLLAHVLIDEGGTIDYGSSELAAHIGASLLSQSEAASQFKVDNTFRMGAYDFQDHSLNKLQYFHLFLHDCAHFLLRGFHVPKIEFDLFRIAWIGSEHHARWFSDYEIQKCVQASPYWRKWKPHVDLETLPESDQAEIVAAAGSTSSDALTSDRHHTWYEMLRDAGVVDEGHGRRLLLKINTNQEYEVHWQLAREFIQAFNLSDDYAHSVWEQLTRNALDEGYIANAFDEINGNEVGRINFDIPPEVKLHGNNMVDDLLGRFGEQLTDQELKKYIAPSTACEEELPTLLHREAFERRFSEYDESQRDIVWQYLDRCARVMEHLLDKKLPGR